MAFNHPSIFGEFKADILLGVLLAIDDRDPHMENIMSNMHNIIAQMQTENLSIFKHAFSSQLMTTLLSENYPKFQRLTQILYILPSCDPIRSFSNQVMSTIMAICSDFIAQLIIQMPTDSPVFLEEMLLMFSVVYEQNIERCLTEPATVGFKYALLQDICKSFIA